MSLKVISNGVVVDALIHPTFVRYDPRLKLFLSCKEEEAQGLASHDGETYWQLQGKHFGVDGYETVSAVVISPEEAAAIIEALDDGKPGLPDPEDEDPNIPEDVPLSSVLSRAELTAKVTELDEALQMLLSGVTEEVDEDG